MRRCFLIGPLLGTALLVAAESDDLQRLAKAVRGLAAERAAVAAEPRVAPGDGCLRLTLLAALPAREGDLVVEVLYRGGSLHAARGRAPGYSPLIFAVDASALQAAPGGGALGGTLQVAVAHWTDKRREDPHRGVPQPGRWTLSGDRQRATATLVDPATAPYSDGPCTVTQCWIPTSIPAFPVVPAADQLSVLASVEALGAQAQDLYADIRALELQARTGLPFTLARRELGATRWDYLPRHTGADGGGEEEDESTPEAGSGTSGSAPASAPRGNLAPVKRPPVTCARVSIEIGFILTGAY